MHEAFLGLSNLPHNYGTAQNMKGRPKHSLQRGLEQNMHGLSNLALERTKHELEYKLPPFLALKMPSLYYQYTVRRDVVLSFCKSTAYAIVPEIVNFKLILSPLQADMA